jgi:hypothetical protein
MNKSEIYTPTSIVTKENGDSYIEVTIANQLIELPMQLVKTLTDELLLAWVDANREEITKYGALALAELLAKINPGLVLSPFSSKSIPMATQAVDHWNINQNKDIPLLTLFGGKDLEQVQSQTGSDGFIHSYNPVTSTRDSKYVGIPSSYVNLIHEELIKGHAIAILDDVYGTGATANAVRDVIRSSTQLNISNNQLPVLVVAREVEGIYEQQEEENVFASIILPIIRMNSI